MKNILPILLLSLFGCNTQMRPIQYFQAFQNMRWLAGTWEGEYESKPFCETWVIANDTLLTNKNIDCATGADQSGGALIQVLDGQIFYTNNPESKEKLLKWQLADCDTARVRFTNPNAPYSQTMIFEHTPDDRWRAILVTKGDTLVHLLRRKN